MIRDFIAYSSYIISKLYHLDSLMNSVEQARRKIKREFKKCALSHKQFNHTVLFLEIKNKVFIMPNIEHLSHLSIPSILDNSIKTPLIFTTTKNYERYFTLKHRKCNVDAEYLENQETPIHKTYRTLDLVRKLLRDDYHIRYGDESRVHQFLSNNPIILLRGQRILKDQALLQIIIILHWSLLHRPYLHCLLLLTLLRFPILQRPILHLLHLLHLHNLSLLLFWVLVPSSLHQLQTRRLALR